MINVPCPACQTLLGCPDESAGAAVACVKCGTSVPVPAPLLETVSPWDTFNLPLADAAEPPAARSAARLPAPAFEEDEPEEYEPEEDEPEDEKPAGGWYYEHNGRSVGPVTERALHAAAENNRLAADARVWTAGMDEWQPGREVLPQVFEGLGGSWGVQRVLAVILATVAFASLIGLGGVYAAKPKPGEEAAKKGKDETPAPPVKNNESKEKDKPKDKDKDKGKTGIGGPVVTPPSKGDFVDALVARAKAGKADDRVKALNELKAMGAAAQKASPALIALLDDTDDTVWRAADEALKAVGPPAKEQLGSVVKALESGKPRAKRYALGYYSANKAERAELLLCVAALDAKEPETREAAVRAIAFYGPNSKPVALDKLFDRLIDLDPAVVALATQTLESFRPFEGADRAVLIRNLTHGQPIFRYLSIRLLNTKEYPPDWETALALFGPRVADAEQNPLVREQAIIALARWGELARPLAPTLIERTNDEKVAVRIAAVRALGDIGGGPGVAPALAKFLDQKSEKADPRLRAPAVQALIRVEMSNAATDLPILKLLLAEADTATRAAALTKLAGFGADAAPLLPQVGDGLKDPDSGVRAAALRAVAAVGPKAAGLAPAVAKLASDPSRDGNATRKLALDALTKMGEKGADELSGLLGNKLPRDVREGACARLAEFGPKLPQSAVDRLLEAALADSDLRPKIAPPLAKCGTDYTSAELRKRLAWTRDNLKRRMSKHPIDYQLWVYAVLDEFDAAGLSTAEKDKLREGLEFHGGLQSDAPGDPDPTCKAAARAAYAKLKSTLTTKK